MSDQDKKNERFREAPELPQEKGAESVDEALDIREREGRLDPSERIDESLEELSGEKGVWESMESLDAMRPLKEQEEVKLTLETYLETLVRKGFHQGLSREEILKSPLKLQNVLEKGTSEAAIGEGLAISKLEALLKNKANLEWWREFLEENEKEYTKIKNAKERLEKGETPESMKDLTPVLKYTAMALGAIGLTVGVATLIRHFKKEKSQRKKGEGILGGVLTAIGVGSLVGSGAFGGWATKAFGLSLSAGSITDFFKNAIKFKFGKAFEGIKLNTQHPGIKAASEHWDIPQNLLIDWKDSSFSKLKEANKSGTALGLMGNVIEGVFGNNLPNFGLVKDAKEMKWQAQLESKIERNKSVLKNKNWEEMSVAEILDEFEKNAVFEKKTPTEERENIYSNIPHVKTVIDLWNQGEMDSSEAAIKLIEASAQDGAGIVIEKFTSYIVYGGKVLLLSNISIVSNTIQQSAELLTGQKESLWEAATDYGISYLKAGGIFWVGGGAAMQGMRGWIESGTWGAMKGAAQGAGKGLIQSHVLIPKTLGQMGVYSKQMIEGLSLSAKEYSNLSPRERLQVQNARVKYYGDLYEYYHRMNEGAKTLKSRAYKAMAPKWAEQMQNIHGEAFIKAKNALLKTAAEEGIELGIESGVQSAGFKESAGSRDRLAREVEEFRSKKLQANLESASEFVHNKPKFSTAQEALEAGAVKPMNMTRRQAERLQAHGFNEKALLRLAEYELTPQELEVVLDQLDENPLNKKVLEEVLFNAKYTRLAQTLRTGALALTPAIIFMSFYEYEKADDKAQFLAEQSFSDVSALGVGWAASQPIPHPIAKVLVGLTAGTAAYLGAGAVYRKYGRPMLERYAPNAHEKFETPLAQGVNDYLAFAASPTEFLNKLSYFGDTVFSIGDGVNGDTDPMEYLQVSSRFMHPKTWFDFYRGDFQWVMQDHRPHDITTLRRNAEQSLKAAEKELAELENDPIREEKLKHDILQYKSWISDQWIEEKQMENIQVKLAILDPANEYFQTLAQNKFGEKAGLEAYQQLMEKINRGEKHIETGGELELWRFLAGEKARIENETIPFIDFVALSVGVAKDQMFLHELKKSLNQEKTRTSEELTAV